jgi:hypothetical protein
MKAAVFPLFIFLNSLQDVVAMISGRTKRKRNFFIGECLSYGGYGGYRVTKLRSLFNLIKDVRNL